MRLIAPTFGRGRTAKMGRGQTPETSFVTETSLPKGLGEDYRSSPEAKSTAIWEIPA